MSITDTKGLAQLLKCSERHVIDLKNQRLIPQIKLGRSVRFCIEDVEGPTEVDHPGDKLMSPATSPESPPEKGTGAPPCERRAQWRQEHRKLNLRGHSVKHPFRLLLARLPWQLDRLAWLGLPNYRRDGWRAE